MLIHSGELENEDSIVNLEKKPEMKIIKLITFAAYQMLMKNNDPQGFISLISTAIPLY